MGMQSLVVKHNLFYNFKLQEMGKTILIAMWALLISNMVSLSAYNSSLCTDIVIGQLHYFINQNQNSFNIYAKLNEEDIVYNLCKEVEVYCPYQNAVLVASLVSISNKQMTCTPYTQTYVRLINQTDLSSGISVTYLSQSEGNLSITMKYQCRDGSIGCPSVEEGIMWQYFAKGLLTYTIVIEVIGIILMVFGIYIYRASIVLIGWGTSTLILLIIESFFVFLKGVPDNSIETVMIITLVCSFFVGYILGYFPKAGVVCLGLWIGGVIALTLNNIAFYYIKSNPPNLMLYIIAPVLCIAFGIIILYIRRAFITFASSLIGSYISLRALSWYLGGFPNEFQLSKKYHLGLTPPVPWQFYLYVIALLILTASSSALQTWLFKKKMSRANQATDIEKHLDQMESNLRKQRDGLIQFKNVFEGQSRKPKVLAKSNSKRSHQATIVQNNFQDEQNGSENDEQEQEQSFPDYTQSEQEDPKERELKQGLIKGRRK